LFLSDPVYQLDAADSDCCILELLESQHWINSLLHSPVILFNQVIEVLACTVVGRITDSFNL
jgi:hypothetical protein